MIWRFPRSCFLDLLHPFRLPLPIVRVEVAFPEQLPLRMLFVLLKADRAEVADESGFLLLGAERQLFAAVVGTEGEGNPHPVDYLLAVVLVPHEAEFPLLKRLADVTADDGIQPSDHLQAKRVEGFVSHGRGDQILQLFVR